MGESIAGIHHVTAIATDPQRNLDFYAGVLGLRLVKRTVNFDDPTTYHLYFGDTLGRPGTILTFFPWPRAARGSRGAGQATAVALSVPEGSMDYWRDRLAAQGVLVEAPERRFGEEVVALYDPDGLKLELVAHAGAREAAPWSGGAVPDEHAVRGFFGVTLTERDADVTLRLLGETFGMRPAGHDGARHRLEAVGAGPGRRVDVIHAPEAPFGRIAAGTVHHVAWRLPEEAAQRRWREALSDQGLHPTDVLDRQYFRSIYFREPGGVLFELATDPPGFVRDEAPEALGSALKLPPWLEPHRSRLEEHLPPLTLPATGVESR